MNSQSLPLQVRSIMFVSGCLLAIPVYQYRQHTLFYAYNHNNCRNEFQKALGLTNISLPLCESSSTDKTLNTRHQSPVNNDTNCTDHVQFLQHRVIATGIYMHVSKICRLFHQNKSRNTMPNFI